MLLLLGRPAVFDSANDMRRYSGQRQGRMRKPNFVSPDAGQAVLVCAADTSTFPRRQLHRRLALVGRAEIDVCRHACFRRWRDRGTQLPQAIKQGHHKTCNNACMPCQVVV